MYTGNKYAGTSDTNYVPEVYRHDVYHRITTTRVTCHPAAAHLPKEPACVDLLYWMNPMNNPTTR